MKKTMQKKLKKTYPKKIKEVRKGVEKNYTSSDYIKLMEEWKNGEETVLVEEWREDDSGKDK